MRDIRVEFIHIGIPKSGSTWLQRGLFDKHPALQVLGVVARTDPLASFNEIISLLYESTFDPKTFDLCLHSVSHLLPYDRKLGISNENLSGWPTWMGLAMKVPNRLKMQFGDVKIIIILRHPVTYMQSAYVQAIRSGFRTKSFDDFMAIKENRQKLALRVNYNQLLEIYMELFSRVLVLPFELLVDDSQDFSDRICDFLNVEHYTTSPQPNNTAISYVIQECMRRTNRIDLALWAKHRYFATKIWPRINRRRIPLPKMKRIGFDYYQKYPEFDILQPQNYEIWKGELAQYNYKYPQ